MGPLTAISQSGVPELRPVRGAGVPGVPGAIPIQELAELGPPGAAGVEGAARSFGALFGQMVGEVTTRQAAAGEAVTALLSGQNLPLHQAMIAMEEASVSFQLMVEVRNKLMEAYQELMRMAV